MTWLWAESLQPPVQYEFFQILQSWSNGTDKATVCYQMGKASVPRIHFPKQLLPLNLLRKSTVLLSVLARCADLRFLRESSAKPSLYLTWNLAGWYRYDLLLSSWVWLQLFCVPQNYFRVEAEKAWLDSSFSVHCWSGQIAIKTYITRHWRGGSVVLRTPASLVKVLSSVPSIHMETHNHL